MPNTQSVSIVIPVYNEQDNLSVLFDEIARAMRPLNREWEVVFVDDGSTDTSLDVLKRLAAENVEVRYIAFTKNRGQSAAFCAGFDQSAFPIVVTMDADLQNDPADIPAMLALFDQGYGMAIGWRKKTAGYRQQALRLENRQRHTKPHHPRKRARHRLLPQDHAPRAAAAHPSLQGNAPLPAHPYEA